MPSWSEIYDEVNMYPPADRVSKLQDKVNELLEKIGNHTNRNVITYYSGWLKGVESIHTAVNENDINAFMQAIHNLDKSKGLDLILHTPGGDIGATESIIDYLHSIFGNNIRAIIPQISMSAGSMIALSCAEIMMGKQSSLGPTDPQMGGVACGAVLEEFEKAKQDVSENASSLGLWQVIISKYHPTFLIACENACEWSREIVNKWLCVSNKRKKFISLFTDHTTSKSHSRHISKEKCKQVGLNIIDMEDDPVLQDLILTLHHSYMILFDISIVIKIVMNNIGATYLRTQNITPSSFN